jgi:signal transduction histidine kinase
VSDKAGLASAELESLRREVADLRAHLAAAEARAREVAELDRLTEEFIAAASHDLKAPLTTLRGYAQLLLRRLQHAHPDLRLIERGLTQIDAQTHPRSYRGSFGASTARPRRLPAACPVQVWGSTSAAALSKRMGGRLWAESEGVGQGATIRFTLPDDPPRAGSTVGREVNLGRSET